ncbi:MAG: WD40 repeat domain-containing protein [Gemmataceae bacterium]
MRRRFLLAMVLVCLGVASARGQAIQELRGHRAAVYAIAFRPDGERMATASFDHTIKVWDVESGRAVRTFTGHQDKVLALAYSADGQRLASAGLDGTIRLWDAANGRLMACLTSRNRCVQGIAFTPDGNRLIACGEAGIAEVWRTGSVSCRVESVLERTIGVETERMPLYAAAVAPDGQTLALAGLDGRIRLHDLATGKPRRILEGHADAVYSLAFSPDNGSLASGSVDQTVRCWQLATGAQSACLDGHRGAVYQVGFSADGRRLVSAGTDGEVMVWDAGNGNSLHRHRFPGKTLCAAFTPDGRHVAAGSERSACYLLELPRHVR